MKDLAYEADMEYMQLSRIELGKINTSVQQLYKICFALGISLTELFKSVEEEIKNVTKDDEKRKYSIDSSNPFLFNTTKSTNK